MDVTDQYGYLGDTEVSRLSKHSHTEVFELGTDLSYGERYIVADAMRRDAQEIYATGDWKRGGKLVLEADRYQNCRLEAGLFDCRDCELHYYAKIVCRSRICEHCGRIYGRRLRQKMVPLISQVAAKKKKGYFLSLLTLTVTSERWGDRMPDRKDIDRLYKETSLFLRRWFGKYKTRYSKSGKVVEVRRKKKQLEKGQSPRIWIGAGWIATLEVGADNNNAHCHAIVYGPYRPYEEMLDDWKRITGDSSGVHIKPAHNPAKMADYILKYITKPPMTDDYTRIARYARMIKGTRRLRTGGAFYNKIKADKRESTGRCRCLKCGGHLFMAGTGMLTECWDRIDLAAGFREKIVLEPEAKPTPSTSGGASSERLPQRQRQLSI